MSKLVLSAVALLALCASASAIATLCDPKKAPPLVKNIKLKNTTNSGDYSNIAITWESGTVKETDGCSTAYSVEVYKKGASSATQKATVTASNPIANAEYNAKGLSPATEYVFKIIALNTGLQGSAQSLGSINSPAFKSAPKAAVCDPKKAPPLVKNIKMKNTTNSGDYSNIAITWESGTVKSTDGCSTSYTVEVYKKGASSATQRATVTASSPTASAEYNAKGLSPSTEYVFKIIALNTKLQGSSQSLGSINSPAFMSAPKAAYCDAKKAPGAASDIKVDSNKFDGSSGYSKVVLSWTPPKSPSGCATSWAVETIDMKTNKAINTITVSVSNPSSRVTWNSSTLIPGNKYGFKITGKNSKAQGAQSNTSVGGPTVTAAPKPTAVPAH
jgi:hypothetical protein